MKKKYVTTPIYYPSAKLHIGNAYSTVAADAIAKYYRLKGEDVYFLTGTDEHGEKIQKKAMEQGVTPIEYVNPIVSDIQKLWKLLDIQYDDFIRTTEKRHMEAVKKIFTQLQDQGDIYKGLYEGYYCTPCETFFTEIQLKNGKCPDCGRDVHLVKEEAYFFKMSKYADRLMAYYEQHPEFIMPISRKNEMLNTFLKPGLEDLCVSRTSFDWGIKVENDEKHIVYVWIDALSNYITALGYKSEDSTLFNKYWSKDTEKIHLLGKDIARFHTIYWPILLMALDLPLPNKIFAHGWITMKEGKMSKSIGNVVYPEMLIEQYGLDALRYYMLREVSFGQDSMFTPEIFLERINTDLANDIGNLLSRTVSMIEKYFDGVLPAYQELNSNVDHNYQEKAYTLAGIVDQYMQDLAMDKALKSIFDFVSCSNKYIDETQPWVLAKEETNKVVLGNVMNQLANGLRISAVLLQPFLSNAPQAIFTQLNIPKELQNYESLTMFNSLENVFVTKGHSIFQRVDVHIESEYINEQMKKGQ